jgi:hypothetical protein
MGTNYYLITAECSHCGRSDRQHIGKSSAGWAFLFQGSEDIRSYADWLRVLPSGRIVDEYDNNNTMRLEAFTFMVEAKCLLKQHALPYPDDTWFDANGHNFIGHEFS